jgi:voltage-gated potassium channel
VFFFLRTKDRSWYFKGLGHIRSRLIFITSLILITVLGGTAGFVIIEHYSPFDAFYFTLTTISTVGYGEIYGLSRSGRIFNSFLIFFGVISLFLAIGGVTQTVIELEFNQYFGKRRIRNMIHKLDGHFIVCGYGRVGRGAAAELVRASVPFVVVDKDEHKVELAMKHGMLAVLADANRDETLLDVGLMRARGLIATLSTDADNLFLLLSAKGLKPGLPVCARIAEEASEQKFRRAGADFVFAPYDITGNRMAQALLKPHVFQFIDFTTKDMGLDVGIEQVRVGSGSGFASRTLAQLQIRRELGVIVLAIRRSNGRMVFNPPADAEIHAGDYLVVMGESGNLQKLEQMLSEVRA